MPRYFMFAIADPISSHFTEKEIGDKLKGMLWPRAVLTNFQEIQAPAGDKESA